MHNEKEHLRLGLGRYFSAEALKKLRSAYVGIAGAGGLGSNAAMLLARSGIENMRIIDSDHIENSNLNRQHYWPHQIGMAKVEALQENLLNLNPGINLDIHQMHICKDNLDDLLADCPIWLEALDTAVTKAMFVEKALLKGAFVVAASGLCGIGGASMEKRRLGNLTLVGDFVTGLDCAPPYAPRVTQAAALMADCVLVHILQKE